jgi:hypothetical protein
MVSAGHPWLDGFPFHGFSNTGDNSLIGTPPPGVVNGVIVIVGPGSANISGSATATTGAETVSKPASYLSGDVIGGFVKGLGLDSVAPGQPHLLLRGTSMSHKRTLTRSVMLINLAFRLPNMAAELLAAMP